MNYEKRRQHILDIKEKREKLLVPDAVALFMRSRKLKNARDSTIYSYKLSLNIFTRFLEGNGITRLSDVITEDIQEFIERRLDSGNKPITVNKYIRELRAFFNFLHSMGYIEVNPIESVEKLIEHKTIIKTLSQDQIAKLIAVPDVNTYVGFRNYTFILLLLDTGLRLDEALNITLTDIDWKRRLIKVSGKGRKDRFVPATEKMMGLLKSFINRRSDYDHEMLFLNSDGTPLKRRTIQDSISDYQISAGIKGVRVSCHSMRHTFAKMYILNGGDALTLQKILGHSTLEMIRVYIEMFKPDISRQHDTFSPLNNILRTDD